MIILVISVDLVSLDYQVFKEEWKKLCPAVLSVSNGRNFCGLGSLTYE